MFLDSLVIRKMMSSEELLEMIQKDEKPKEVTPILKRQVSWKSIKNIGKKKIFEEEDDNKAPSSQKISIYTDNIFENLSDIYDNKLSVLKSPKSNYSFRRSFSEKRFFV